MSKKLVKEDVILKSGTEIWEETPTLGEKKTDDALILSGELGLGKSGNPVTISIMDEVTGEAMEINHVTNALLVLEDKRRASSGWLSVLIGDLDKIGSIFRLLAQATLDELRRMISR